jgi:hypothetical protein
MRCGPLLPARGFSLLEFRGVLHRTHLPGIFLCSGPDHHDHGWAHHDDDRRSNDYDDHRSTDYHNDDDHHDHGQANDHDPAVPGRLRAVRGERAMLQRRLFHHRPNPELRRYRQPARAALLRAIRCRVQ